MYYRRRQDRTRHRRQSTRSTSRRLNIYIIDTGIRVYRTWLFRLRLVRELSTFRALTLLNTVMDRPWMICRLTRHAGRECYQECFFFDLADGVTFVKVKVTFDADKSGEPTTGDKIAGLAVIVAERTANVQEQCRVPRIDHSCVLEHPYLLPTFRRRDSGGRQSWAGAYLLEYSQVIATRLPYLCPDLCT